MKNTVHILGGLACFGLMLLAANNALAQTSTTTTTTSSGIISQFSPDTIIVKTTSSAEPLSYSYTKTTTYVDENGNPVSIETVKSGLPVTVYYDTEDGKMVATKVVVKKTVSSDPSETTTTQTTITSSPGTIDTLGPDTLIVKSESSQEPVTYRYTKTTTYVDDNGNPISIETVKTGMPVTVYYDTEDGKMVATKVVVKKTSTTTTTTPTNPNP